MELAKESEVELSEADGQRTIRVDPGQPDFRVLIVEDEEENQLILRRLLKGSGFQVRLAENGQQTVELFQSWQPRFIWMDMRMPLMSGKEATMQIRTLAGGRDVKIAAVAASAFDSQREDILAAGVDDFIRKPYQPSEIFDCMARHLGLRRVFAIPPMEQRPSALMTEDLHALPPELVRELAAVVVTLDASRIREVIATISNCDETVGRKLTDLANRSAYSPILTAARACANGLPSELQ